jgi:hypothetical protein
LDKVEDEGALRARLRTAYEEWQEESAQAGIHQAWIRFVLEDLLELDDQCVLRGQDIPAQSEVSVPEHGERLRPDAVVVDAATKHLRLLIQVMGPDQGLERVSEGQRWKVSPATRMMTLLLGSGVRMGVVTNGEEWMLVRAAPNETATFATFTARLWLDEPLTLRAFSSLLGVRRFFSVSDSETLEALFKKSLENPHEVTDQLGLQVRRSVELLISRIDRIDRERGRKLLAGANERDLYEAAVTVMMRLVFLLAAEERRLIPSVGQALYEQHYAVSTLRDDLHRTADQMGEEVLERRHDAWSRLLATFRAVHGGIQYQDLRLIAYGGSLFDPDRFPFLEGRARGSRWREVEADPLPIDNRTVLHLLDALQVLEVKIRGGGPSETHRLSFRALGVEQIGHVYESLLDHTAVRAEETFVGLEGTKTLEPELALSDLDRRRKQGAGELVSYLQDETGRSESALKKAFEYKIPAEHEDRLRLACGETQALYGRVKPYAGLLRDDTFGVPVVIPEGSVYVTQSSERRSTGTHYTPPSLTEPVVQHALDPLVYEGPADGKPRAEWKLKSPAAILGLRVCDMAMGSGAFLVQACRYLATCLVEAWDEVERASEGRLVVTPEGELGSGDPRERPLPRDTEERLLLGRRFVADRCLYGVDLNPMAVEIAKLSLWLTTLQKDRPFTFLDHAFRVGDALLGLTEPDQLEHFHLRPEVDAQLVLQGKELRAPLKRALDARRKLESIPVVDIGDVQEKERLLAEAREAMAELKVVADLLSGTALAGNDETRGSASLEVTGAFKAEAPSRKKKLAAVAALAADLLGRRRPFHWVLEFPEVFLSTTTGERGFHTIVGNPPFQGGKLISGALGSDYREYLVSELAGGVKGHADLSAYFFLRAKQLLRGGGSLGLLATNTIAQGDTREVGLDQIAKDGLTIYRAIPTRPWPGEATLEISHVWVYKGRWSGECRLDDAVVSAVTSSLKERGRVEGTPFRLAENAGKSFIGSYVLGMGFVLQPEQAKDLIKKDKRNKQVVFPYLIGADLNSEPDQFPTRWVINFHDWPLDHKSAPKGYAGPVAADFPDCLDIVKRLVKPERQRKKENGDYALRSPLPQRWWHYADKRPGLYAAIAQLDQVLVTTQTSSTQMPALSRNGIVFGHKVVVFATDSLAQFAVQSSAIHREWVLERGSTMRTDAVYTPSDCFDTFPFPVLSDALYDVGRHYNDHRASVMMSSSTGITPTYGRFHDPGERDKGIVTLRELHVEMDCAVRAAYGWSDIDLEHDFHQTRQGLRFSIGEKARSEILARLLQLNHERFAIEVKGGLHPNVASSSDKATKTRKPRAKKTPAGQREWEF